MNFDRFSYGRHHWSKISLLSPGGFDWWRHDERRLTPGKNVMWARPNSRIVNCISIFILIFHTFTSVFMFRVTFFKSYDNSTSEKTKIRCHDRSQLRDCVYRGSDAILPRIAILVLLRTINTKQLANR